MSDEAEAALAALTPGAVWRAAELLAGADPRWEWIEVPEFGREDVPLIRGRCRHLELADVYAADGELVARLCLTCDRSFYQGSAAG